MSAMARIGLTAPLFLTLLLLFGSLSSSSASPSPSKIVNGVLSNAASKLVKWAWSLKATTKTVVSGRPMMKFESGYSVETVFDGSKLGIEPHTVEVLPSGELLILDSANSNLYKISSALSQYTRPRLVAGSADGYSGHVDGKTREARMNHPKGLTVDDKGNIYIADTDNMAIRKISETGVTTIAGGKWNRGGGHVDGPSEDAKFSTDFDVVYIGSSCSLLVIDRGNKAIREIQLHFDDCAYQYGSGFPLGIAVLLAAGFFGYMLALLQRRVGTMVSSENDEKTMVSSNPYEKPIMSSVMPPLIPPDNAEEKQEESFFGSLGKLMVQAGESLATILGGDSYVISEKDEPPSIDMRSPTPQKTYAFMSKDSEKMQKLRQSRAFYSEWGSDFQQQQQTQKHLNHHRYHSAAPQTVYEQSPEKTNEVVFGAVQEQEGQNGTMVIKPLEHATQGYNHQNHIRARFNTIGYTYGP
nr:NHL repeat-containing protein [Ipomoea batatas]